MKPQPREYGAVSLGHGLPRAYEATWQCGSELAASLARPTTDPLLVTLAPGLHRHFDPSAYYERVCGVARKSTLDLMRPPARYKAWLEGLEDEATPALIFGQRYHLAALEPARFVAEYAIEPQFGPLRADKARGVSPEEGKANKDRRDAWRAKNAGRTFLPAEDALRIRGMTDALAAHPLAARWLAQGESELTVRWDDDETGIPCAARLDKYLPELRACVDLKSIDSIERFPKHVAEYGYHRQAAHYLAGLEAVGEPVDHFVFLVQEKAPPYLLAARVLSADALDRGERSRRRDLRTFAECLAKDSWPGLPERIETVELPRWYQED